MKDVTTTGTNSARAHRLNVTNKMLLGTPKRSSMDTVQTHRRSDCEGVAWY